MSKDEAATDEPFWRKPLPPIPGPRSSVSIAATDIAAIQPDETPEVLPLADELEHVVTKDVAPVLAVSREIHDPCAALKAAEHALVLARQEARERRAATQAARTAFAKALERWNSAGTVMTQEQQARQFIATSNADRARRAAAAGGSIVHAGITRTAKAMAGGNQRRGGGGAFRRGPGGTQAFSKAEALTVEANRLRLAAAAAAAAKPGGQK